MISSNKGHTEQVGNDAEPGDQAMTLAATRVSPREERVAWRHVPLEENVAFHMASVVYLLDQILRDRVLRRLNLSYNRFRVLQYLSEHDGALVGEIAAAIAVRQSVCSRVIDQLEDASLARCRSDPDDSRRVRTFLTGTGRGKYREAWWFASELLDKVLYDFDDVERKTMLGFLARMSRNLNVG